MTDPTHRPRPSTPKGAIRLVGGAPASPESLLEQGRLAESRAQWDVARDLYERGLHAVDATVPRDLVRALLIGLARSLHETGDSLGAREQLETVFALAPHPAVDPLVAAALELRGRMHWAMGELDLARDDVQAAHDRAVARGDAQLSATCGATLAGLAEVRGEAAGAILGYEESLAQFRASGDVGGVARALGRLAPLYADLQRWNDAEQAFAEELQLATAHGDHRALLRVELGRVDMAIIRQTFERARASCERALDLARRLGDTAAQSYALMLAGVVTRELGDSARAERQLEQAERMAIDAEDRLVGAEAACEKAELFGRQDRHQQTLMALNRAYRLLTQLRGRRTELAVARRLRRLEAGFVDVVRRWAQRIESKDHATSGHCERVADMTCDIARRIGVDAASLLWYRVGALLHDLGKLAIPAAILNKAGRLTADEWALVKRHPTLGAEMLGEVDFPWEVRPIVESHHECWDGSGYPHGLAESQIPLAARVFCVADVFDALVSQRSFKRALTPDEAVEVMRRDVGRQFDPAVFRAFEDLVRERLQNALTWRVPAPTADQPAHASIDDALTAVAERQSFMQQLSAALAARRSSARPVSVLAVDLDWFRLINETYGRLQGDDILWAVAKVLQRGIRAGDVVGRRGGDEFLVLLPDAAPAVAEEVAERLRDAAMQLRCVRRDAPDETIALTVSIGMACSPHDGDAAESIVAAADRALFRAKQEGRNRVAKVEDTALLPIGARLDLGQFVGREEELRALVTLLDHAAGGDPRVAAIVGEAGIGKSALLRQLEPEARLRSGVMVTARCTDGEIKSPLAPWADVVLQLHERGAVPPREWRALPALVPALALPHTAMRADAPAADLHNEIVQYMRAAARTHPLVVVLDDAHWADTASWDVVEALAASLEHDRLLLCLTLRPEDARHLAERRRHLSQHAGMRQVALRRFSLDELRRWVQLVFHEGDLGHEFPAFLHEYTEGIPLHVVHVLRSLYEEGGIWYGGTRWEWRPVDELALPSALGEVLQRRLDRLSPSARHVLATAAVIGPSFDLDLLLAGAAAAEGEVRAAIDEGVAAAVLEPTGDARSRRFAFTHALLADASRRSIPERQRQRLHEITARMLELRTPTAVSEIATHYHAAGNDEQAFHYALLAAQRSSSVYAHDEAIASLRIALRHAPSPAEQAGVRVQLAALAEGAGRYEYAEEMCGLALEYYGANPDPDRALAAERLREALRVRRGRQPQRAIDALTGLLLAPGAAEGAGRASVLLALADLHGLLADWTTGEPLAREAMDLAQLAGDAALQGEASLQLGRLRFASEPAEAPAFLRDAIARFADAHDERGEARAWHASGLAQVRAGHLSQATVALVRAADLARGCHSASVSADVALAFAELELRRGNLDATAEWLSDAVRLASALRDEPARLLATLVQARVEHERGEDVSARDLYQMAAAGARDLGVPWVEAVALSGGMHLVLDHNGGDIDAAWTRVSELRAGAPAGAWFPGRELVDSLGVRIALGTGHVSVALDLFTTGMESVESRDAWGACWLAAECAPALLDAGLPAAEGTIAVAARRARQQEFSLLSLRLAGYRPGELEAQ